VFLGGRTFTAHIDALLLSSNESAESVADGSACTDAKTFWTDTDIPNVGSSVGFAVWTNGTTVAGKTVYTPAKVEFSATPASAGQCWDVIDMFGVAAAKPRVCASAGATLAVDVPVNGTATGPIYLMPVAAR
jgi:hypothetical protein